MSEKAMQFSETVQNTVEEQGIQISSGLKTSLLTNRGKKATMYHAELSAEEQGKVEEVFGFLSEKLIKKADATSTATSAEIVTEAKEGIEVDPEAEVEK